RHRHRGASQRGHDRHAQMPHRSRAGVLGERLRRPSACDLAGASHGSAVHRAGLRAPAFSRSPGAGRRCRACEPGLRALALAALARSALTRNRVTEEPRPNPHWPDAIEHETAELAVAVAALRAETVTRLSAALAVRRSSPFPSAEIALEGWMEKLLPQHSAREI